MDLLLLLPLPAAILADMSDNTPTFRHVSLDEAATLLGVSRRTVERRLADGTLTGQKQGRRWLVQVVDTDRPEADTTGGGHDGARRDNDDSDGLRAQVAELTRQLEDMRRDRDVWRDQAQREQMILANLTTQRQIPEKAESLQPSKPSWWQFWK